MPTDPSKHDMTTIGEDIRYGHDSDLGFWCVQFFCGIQWNAMEVAGQIDAKAYAEALERFRARTARMAVNRTLDEALNSGDGAYRP